MDFKKNEKRTKKENIRKFNQRNEGEKPGKEMK